MRIIHLLMSLLLASLAGAAQAATYIGHRNIGTGSADLSFTTDGTIGVLSTANILGWTVSLQEGGDSITLQGPTSGNNSQLSIFGSALSATANEISFDFSANGLNVLLIQFPFLGAGGNYYCVQTSGCVGSRLPQELVGVGPGFGFQANFLQGDVVLASVQATPIPGPSVPEPASWALMVFGFAVAGASLRARKMRVRFA
jgi:PEP-CTERM motif